MPNFDQSDAAPGGPETLPEPLPADPLPLFEAWFNEALERRLQPNPNAMTLATLGPQGELSARIVLCKAIDTTTGHVVFFTNYTSFKGWSLDHHPHAAIVMHWDHLDRQVRITGPVVRSPEAESDAYFATRPWPSRIGAWASSQSLPISDRAAMHEKVDEGMRRFGIDPANPPPDDADVQIPRPPHWGGYRVFIEAIELWSSGRGRVHDRARWHRSLEQTGPHLWQPTSGHGDAWVATRLQP